MISWAPFAVPAREPVLVRRVAPPAAAVWGALWVAAALAEDFNVRYDEKAADGPVEHWSLPAATHTDAIYEQREAYEQRVVAFFDEELGR